MKHETGVVELANKPLHTYLPTLTLLVSFPTSSIEFPIMRVNYPFFTNKITSVVIETLHEYFCRIFFEGIGFVDNLKNKLMSVACN